MVSGYGFTERGVKSLHNFEQGFKLNSDNTVKPLEIQVKDWMGRVAVGRPRVRRQESTPCPTSAKNQIQLSENVCGFGQTQFLAS